MKKHRKARGVYANITVGLQLGITVFIFVYAGYRLDLYFNRSPLFLAAGTLFGMAAGFYNLIKELQSLKEREEREKKEEDEEKIRWM